MCVEPLDFSDPSLFYQLHQAGLLMRDEEDATCFNMPQIRDLADLKMRLQSAGVTHERAEQAMAVWSKSAVDRFSTRKASFRGAYFAKPGSVEFRNLSLEIVMS